ncbi:MAG: ferritin-like domain-containing protein [Lysobacteraceae bacterium]
MDKRIRLGSNRTGLQASPLDADDLVEGLALQEGAPRPDIGAADIRASYARDDATVGSMPPPTSLKGVVGAIAGTLSGQRLHVLLDKLGERAAFERTGARLYDAMLLKIAVAARLPGDMTVAAVQAIRDDEASHARMLGEAIEALGGDPTVQTPCADLAGVQGMGLVQAMNEPRATLSQALQTLLAAELIDVASWELLISLAEELEHPEWTTRFADALASETEHLARVRDWLRAAIDADATIA